MKVQYVLIALILIIVLTGSIGTVAVSASTVSNPGDYLYGLGKTIENFQRSNITDPFQKVQFENEIMRERLSELDTLQQYNSNNLNLGLQEVAGQYQRLQQSIKDCPNCQPELKQSCLDLIKTSASATGQIMNQARIGKNSVLENTAIDLETKLQDYIATALPKAKVQQKNRNIEQQAENQQPTATNYVPAAPQPIQQVQQPVQQVVNVQQSSTQPQPKYYEDEYYEAETENND